MNNYIYTFCQLILLSLTLTANAQKLHTTKWESGQLDRRTKVGVWEYYGYTASKERVVVQRYDHSTNELLYFRPSGEFIYNIEATPGQWQRHAVDRPPLFIGGDPALAVYTTQLQYPLQAQERNIQGQVTVGFAVDTLGRTSGHRVLRSIGGGCDQEALRVARTIPNEWIPARVGSHAVAAEYELTLTFRLAQP
ncbi:energy transducer TonB [Hymenobacter sp. M29]|uniref:Energy transducer TonB n=1 Tax=Hymenobacter mellowenesis TaxID=3063995 RepID=A0ABT9A5Y4_9BACT|nr:energy transducer TonB [Hymenobacter sp. M29]MDO7845247.1 energy transducer TonB [Hymenobacter sp. M29]